VISFACFAPHPPIILPEIGSAEDRKKVKLVIESLKKLGEKFRKVDPDLVIISSPHPDWGIKVPLYFLISENQSFKYQNYQSPSNLKIEPSYRFIYPVLTTLDSCRQHFEWGKNLKIKDYKLKVALVASGDMSHCLKSEGPYGFHPDGPKFDKAFIEALRKKDLETIFELNDLYPEAGECGLRSFCFVLGILEGSELNWQPKILAYQGPFGVGYLVVEFNLT